MAIAVKTARTLQASAVNAAGGTTTGSTIDLTTALGGTVTAIITNGGTGPTVACDFILEASTDTSTWREISRQTAGVTAGVTYTFSVNISSPLMYIRSRFTNNTGQSVTVAAELHELTSIG